MVRQGFRKWGLIALAIALLWMVFTVVVLPSAEARGGSHGGARGGIGHGFRGGLHGGDGNRLRHGFHHHRFHNHFFFGVGVGGFFPVYPFAYPYPYPYPYSYPYSVYYPAYTPVYQYQHYSPCGHYDPSGVWINTLCPEYAPPVSATQPESSSQGVSASPAEQSSKGVVEPRPPY